MMSRQLISRIRLILLPEHHTESPRHHGVTGTRYSVHSAGSLLRFRGRRQESNKKLPTGWSVICACIFMLFFLNVRNEFQLVRPLEASTLSRQAHTIMNCSKYPNVDLSGSGSDWSRDDTLVELVTKCSF